MGNHNPKAEEQTHDEQTNPNTPNFERKIVYESEKYSSKKRSYSQEDERKYESRCSRSSRSSRFSIVKKRSTIKKPRGCGCKIEFSCGLGCIKC